MRTPVRVSAEQGCFSCTVDVAPSDTLARQVVLTVPRPTAKDALLAYGLEEHRLNAVAIKVNGEQATLTTPLQSGDFVKGSARASGG